MEEYIEYLQIILPFGLLSLILLFVAKSKGFFQLPYQSHQRANPVALKTVLAVFAIYLGMTMVVAPFLVWIIQSNSATATTSLGFLQLFLLTTIFLLFYLYCNTQDPRMFKKIWKDRGIPHPQSFKADFFIGIGTWILAFPLVVVIGQLADMLLHFLLGFEHYEQVAVRYLKTTLESPSMLFASLFTILIAAPIIEEFLFRGCLQSFFRRHMPTKGAIVLSALCFALFHFAPSQGIGNISLVVSLFTFALFLGFIYERQASLLSSIGLHMTFNAVSTFRILFFPE